MKQTNHKRPRLQVHRARREAATAAGLGSIGWHTFRHTHRSLHSKCKTPLDIQQALL
jgi:integrase